MEVEGDDEVMWLAASFSIALSMHWQSGRKELWWGLTEEQQLATEHELRAGATKAFTGTGYIPASILQSSSPILGTDAA